MTNETVSKEQCDRIRDIAIDCLQLHKSARELTLFRRREITFDAVHKIYSDSEKLGREFDLSWTNQIRDCFHLSLPPRSIRFGQYLTAMEASRHLIERLGKCALLAELVEKDERSERVLASVIDAISENVRELLDGITYENYSTEIQAEWASARKSLPEWSKFRSPDDWEYIFNQLGDECSWKTIKRRMKENQIRRGPGGTDKRVSLAIPDLPHGYSDEMKVKKSRGSSRSGHEVDTKRK